MIGDLGKGIFVGRISDEELYLHKQSEEFDNITQAHRDEYHLFFLQEKGTTDIEIDFKKYSIKPSTVIFIHQNQAHRILSFRNATVSIWTISNENINPEYLKLLNDVSPAEPLELKDDKFLIISHAVTFAVALSKQKEENLYHSLLKGSCNTLIGLVISQYLVQSQPKDKLSRFEVVYKAFNELLEGNFDTLKRPSEYAGQLNISTSYLNECVKNVTGHSVSHHIQQRVILEAKRLLYHSNLSVKEISSQLGYDDYPYFSRVFTKAVGMSALLFRRKNHD